MAQMLVGAFVFALGTIFGAGLVTTGRKQNETSSQNSTPH